MYRRRSAAEMKTGVRKRKRASDAAAAEIMSYHSTALGVGDYNDIKYRYTSQKDTPYEFVAVFASLSSLIQSVKAWSCRHITGWVQAGLDHMYNALKDCPQVSLQHSSVSPLDVPSSRCVVMFIVVVFVELWVVRRQRGRTLRSSCYGAWTCVAPPPCCWVRVPTCARVGPAQSAVDR